MLRVSGITNERTNDLHDTSNRCEITLNAQTQSDTMYTCTAGIAQKCHSIMPSTKPHCWLCPQALCSAVHNQQCGSVQRYRFICLCKSHPHSVHMSYNHTKVCSRNMFMLLPSSYLISKCVSLLSRVLSCCPDPHPLLLEVLSVTSSTSTNMNTGDWLSRYTTVTTHSLASLGET